jgi:hypothetical protein
VSKSVLFLFQILKMITRRTICNNNNNHHYIKRSIFKNKFQKKFIFPTRSARRKQVDSQWLQICVGRKCISSSWWDQDDEIKYVFTPIEQSCNSNLKNILLWTSSRDEERAWANKARLISMFEIEWKTPRHNILVEFLNN